MINSIEFADRLSKLMEYYELSASAFSEEIDFNRSTISHLLSGRNKPSLDFILKVLDRFPEVTISWFLYGKGNFPVVANTNETKSKETISIKPAVEVPKNSTPLEDKHPIAESLLANSSGKAIKRIVIFYTDSSFESYEN